MKKLTKMQELSRDFNRQLYGDGTPYREPTLWQKITRWFRRLFSRFDTNE